MPPGRSILAAVVFGVFLAGCSTTSNPAVLAQNDPYEPTNRAVFDLNNRIDRNFSKPIAKFYNRAVPEPARNGVHNALQNLDKPVVFGNDVLQGESKRACQTFGRFMVNSTVGLAGIVDVATLVGIPDHTEDFGQTLAVWGVGDGPYIVMPFIGPEPPRELAGDIVDIGLDPLTYMKFHGSDTWNAIRGGAGLLDLRARNVENLDQIERSSIDFYATTRSLYRQYRDSEIRNGKPDPNEPDL